jgi:hypothetical protein
MLATTTKSQRNCRAPQGWRDQLRCMSHDMEIQRIVRVFKENLQLCRNNCPRGLGPKEN